jgi:hypothetical protein
MSDKSLHDMIVEIRGEHDKRIFDPKIAEEVFRKGVETLGLPRAMVVLSIRERDLIPLAVRSEIIAGGRRTDLGPEDKIRAFVNDQTNHYKEFTVAELAEACDVNGGQVRAYMRTYGWRFKKSEGRKYEIRPDNKN